MMSAAGPMTVTVSRLEIIRERLVLAGYLAKMEFKRRYASTSGGALWMFLSPLLSIFTIWIALDVGLSASGRFGSEFGVTFAVGLAAWLFFTEVTQTAVSSITSNAHLVKKVVFPVWVVPLSVGLAALVVHLFVLCAVIFAIHLTGITFSLGLLVLPLWIAALLAVSFAVGLWVASLNVRSRDTAIVTGNIIALGFWLTPIVWPLKQLSETWKGIALVNPIAVIIEGYRSSLGVGDTELGPKEWLVFLCVCAAILAAAGSTYRRNRAAFADSL